MLSECKDIMIFQNRQIFLFIFTITHKIISSFHNRQMILFSDKNKYKGWYQWFETIWVTQNKCATFWPYLLSAIYKNKGFARCSANLFCIKTMFWGNCDDFACRLAWVCPPIRYTLQGNSIGFVQPFQNNWLWTLLLLSLRFSINHI